jgi:dienelactone hydrolase
MHRSCELVLLAWFASALALSLHPAWANDADPRIRIINPVTLEVPGEARELTLRVALPAAADGPVPLIVFSHGANSSKDLYDRVADHWAAHGYAVFSPTHIDSESLALGLGPADGQRILRTRVSDLRLLLESPDSVARAAGLEVSLDARRRVIAGHSLGGLMAAVIAGVPIVDPASGESVAVGVPGLSALISLHGVGDIAALDPQGWSQLALPIFALAGTADPARTGDAIERPWRWRLGPYDLAPPGDNYALVLEDGDHYMGGLIGRFEVPGPPDEAGLAAFNRYSTLFLQAYLEDTPGARAKLDAAVLKRPPDITPRASLERR